jgi:hypothetical protein
MSEYTVKAVFLERFARFIQWPAETNVNNPDKPFVIGVIGDNPFGPVLEQLYQKRRIKNKEVEIRYINRIEEINGSNILFISSSCKDNLEEIIRALQGRPILTVADSKGFSKANIHINLYSPRKEIPFQINPAALRSSGLRVDYRLLVLAGIKKKPGQ